MPNKVLVVDNDRDMCQVISDVLKSEGYKVNIAHNGKSALARVKKERFEVMILDYKLSGMSGLTVLEKARQIRPLMQTIMISAYGKPSTKHRAKELGAYDFLDKPFNIRKLAQIVKNALVQEKVEPGLTAPIDYKRGDILCCF
ncbi:response regulator [bacterium]|nr:response regulator [bacterium]